MPKLQIALSAFQTVHSYNSVKQRVGVAGGCGRTWLCCDSVVDVLVDRRSFRDILAEMAGRGDVSDEDQDIDIESDVSRCHYCGQIRCAVGYNVP